MTEPDSGQQLEQIEQKLNEAEKEARLLKVTGRLMALGIAVVAIVMVMILMSPFMAAKNNPQPYIDELEIQAQERLVPLLEAESKELAKAVRPAVLEAWEELQNERLPELITQIEMEARDLVTVLATDLQIRLDEFAGELSDKQQAKLLANIPELEDTDRIERLFVATQNVSDRMVNELFEQHMNALDRLDLAFNSIEVPDEIAAYSASELEEHITQLLTEYIGYQLRDFRIEGVLHLEDPNEMLILGEPNQSN